MPATLLRRWRADTRIQELEARLRCSACGHRGHNSIAIKRVARD
ncbi:MAG: hypothetical protein ACTS10_22175 [Kiloniellales bacterium]